MIRRDPCKHVAELPNKRIYPRTPSGCSECLALGYTKWFSLRLCLTCGHVGCCDDSKYKHATQHFKDTGHPIMRGYKTKHRYRWCFVDEKVV